MKKYKVFLFLTFIFITAFSTVTFGYSKADIPVLEYHVVRNNIPNDSSSYLYVKPEVFFDQINTLKKSGYNFITFSELNDIENGTKVMPERPIIITFDDGYLNNYVYAYPILKELEAKATIFVITNNLPNVANQFSEDKINFMSWEQMQEFSKTDVIDIQSHTNKHENLLSLPLAQGLDTAMISYNMLEHNTGIAPIAISVPYGYTNDAINKMLFTRYKYIIGVKQANCKYNNNVFYRYAITNDMTGQDIINTINKK